MSQIVPASYKWNKYNHLLKYDYCRQSLGQRSWSNQSYPIRLNPSTQNWVRLAAEYQKHSLPLAYHHPHPYHPYLGDHQYRHHPFLGPSHHHRQYHYPGFRQSCRHCHYLFRRGDLRDFPEKCIRNNRVFAQPHLIYHLRPRHRPYSYLHQSMKDHPAN